MPTSVQPGPEGLSSRPSPSRQKWVWALCAATVALLGAGWFLQHRTRPSKGRKPAPAVPSAHIDLGSGRRAEIPAWVGYYPASQPAGAFSSQADGANAGSFTFHTSDSLRTVATFYETHFRDAGLRASTSFNQANNASGALLSGESDKKSAVVVLSAEGPGTNVSVTFKERE